MTADSTGIGHNPHHKCFFCGCYESFLYRRRCATTQLSYTGASNAFTTPLRGVAIILRYVGLLQTLQRRRWTPIRTLGIGPGLRWRLAPSETMLTYPLVYYRCVSTHVPAGQQPQHAKSTGTYLYRGNWKSKYRSRPYLDVCGVLSHPGVWTTFLMTHRPECANPNRNK